jgi:MFS family permease
VNNLRITNDQLPLLFMVSGLCSLVVMPVAGKLSDVMDKRLLFTFASVWMIVVVVVYTNLTPVPLWTVMIVQVMMMMGIMGRMVPSMVLITALPKMADRGAFMSINSSLQQLAGGLAAGLGGLIVVQKTKTSPIEHYDTLGYIMIGVAVANIFMISRVASIIRDRPKEKVEIPGMHAEVLES